MPYKCMGQWNSISTQSYTSAPDGDTGGCVDFTASHNDVKKKSLATMKPNPESSAIQPKA